MVIISLSIEPGKGRKERAAKEDSLYTEVKSECIQCLPVYLDVHHCVPVYLDVHQCVPVYLVVHQCVHVYLDVYQCVHVYVSKCMPYMHTCISVDRDELLK